MSLAPPAVFTIAAVRGVGVVAKVAGGAPPSRVASPLGVERPEEAQ